LQTPDPDRSTPHTHFALVRDLLTPDPAVFWGDFLLTTLLAWSAFVVANLAAGPAGMLAAAAIAVLALYRALCFIHEIVHLRRGWLQGFAWTWNAAVGVPCLFPLFLYDGVHRDHHDPVTYGSARDPEYLPLAGSRPRIAALVLLSAAVPLALALRFLVLAPIGLALPRVHRWLERNASSLIMNPRYVREVDAPMRARIRRSELAMLLMWWPALAAAVLSLLPWRVFGLWYAVMAGVVLLNAIRSLGSHAYRSDGSRLSRAQQVADSIDVRGGWWSELWAPLGLRFHSLHHLFPTIPYHNLPEAHRRLTRAVGSTPIVVRRGLPGTILALWAGRARPRSAPPAPAPDAGPALRPGR
jgi:fatty acid desaturase